MSIEELLIKHLGLNIDGVVRTFHYLEIDQLTSEKGEHLGTSCLLQMEEHGTMSTSCQRTITLAISVAALKAAGVDIQTINEALENE